MIDIRGALELLLVCALPCVVCAAPGQEGAPSESVLYTFPQGFVMPSGPLAVDGNGVLYGTTQIGGGYVQCPNMGYGLGCGTVYSMTPPSSPGGSWTETTLWSFGGTATDPSLPGYGVILGPNGVLYGTTYYGGTASANGCCGTVYSLTPPASPGGQWTEQTIWAFPFSADPQALVMGNGGVLYGTAAGGGGADGIVFELSPPAAPGGAWTETNLWVGNPDKRSLGIFTNPGLQIDDNGVLYASTYDGGAGRGDGVVFSLTPPAQPSGAWKQDILYVLHDSDKLQIFSASLGPGGVLYCVSARSARKSAGTVFSLTPPAATGGAWTEQTIWTFPTEPIKGKIPSTPNAPVLVGADGAVYVGVTSDREEEIYEFVPPSAGQGGWQAIKLAQQAGLGVSYNGALYGASGEDVWMIVP